MLGSGHYGIVLSVKNKDQDQMSALKIVYKTGLSDTEVKIIREEARILERLEGRSNIVQLKNFFETSPYILIEMEYLSGFQLKRVFE